MLYFFSHAFLLQICQVTLQLFDILLSSPLPCVLQELFLCHWLHVPTHPSSSTHASPSNFDTNTTSDMTFSSSVSFVSKENLSPVRKELEEQMKDYLSLLPESLLSCEQVSGSLGLEEYLLEAHQQVGLVTDQLKLLVQLVFLSILLILFILGGSLQINMCQLVSQLSRFNHLLF